MKKDYYEILEVSKTATADEIKKAYRKIALKYHPDRNQGNKDAEEKFKEAAVAYEVLSDPEKRKKYDQFGHAGVDGQTSGHYQNAEDIFRNFGDIFGGGSGNFDPFEAFFGGSSRSGGHTRQKGRKGVNLRIKVKLSLHDIAFGVQKNIKVKKHVVCHTCNGSGAKDASSIGKCSHCGGSGVVRKVSNTILGQMQTTTTCPVCNGRGESITKKCTTCHGLGTEYGEESIQLDIPAGLQDGMQLSVSGKGNAGENGGPAGDLIVQIEVENNTELEIEGQNLIYSLTVNFADAVLGTQVEVPTIEGKAKFKVPAGTPSGKIFRLSGKGLPSVNNYGRGDQLIVLNIYSPKNISVEEKKLLEKLKDSPNFTPKPGEQTEQGFFERMRGFFGSEG